MSTFPIRCFTCGKEISSKYKIYDKRTSNGEDPRDVLDNLKIERICCRRMFMTHSTKELEDIMVLYKSPKDRIERIGIKEGSFEQTRARTKALADE